MITFKQFLQEDEELPDAREFLHRECKPFIQQSHGAGVFLRGVDTRNPPELLGEFRLPSGKTIRLHKMKVRKDRKPMDTSTFMHTVTDEWMQEKFGISGRSGSAFVIGDKEYTAYKDAKSYGDVYAVIPRGDFKFIWSPAVRDLFDQYQYKGLKDKITGLHRDEKIQMIRDELDNLQYTDTDLPGAIKSGREVMLECDELIMMYAMDGYREDINDLQELLK